MGEGRSEARCCTNMAGLEGREEEEEGEAGGRGRKKRRERGQHGKWRLKEEKNNWRKMRYFEINYGKKGEKSCLKMQYNRRTVSVRFLHNDFPKKHNFPNRTN